MEKNYIKWLRSKVGHEKVMLIFAGGIVYDKTGKILLQKRSDFNKWGFPGGAIELNETPEEAAIREIKEETKLNVKITNLFGIYSDDNMEYPNGDLAHSICIVYEMEIINGMIKADNDETLELQFFEIDKLPSMFCKQHEEIKLDLQTKYKMA